MLFVDSSNLHFCPKNFFSFFGGFTYIASLENNQKASPLNEISGGANVAVPRTMGLLHTISLYFYWYDYQDSALVSGKSSLNAFAVSLRVA